MTFLPSELRNLLERSVVRAREISEGAARIALSNLAVNVERPFAALDDEQRRLRNALRAKARQLGNGVLSDGFPLLTEEIAYVQWHRMLFARFLAENNLLIHPAHGVPVILAECEELAPTEGEEDAWQLAARYASAMLPGIFRADDPCVHVRFALEGRVALEKLVSGLPPTIFAADDALGWVYQFWQSKKKDEVNKSERKIGGADLAPVTQLFTEDYMVRFLLENTLGAWWAARHPNSPLLREFAYLRFLEDGTPAAGTFTGWPSHAAQITMMDPCCGSGHFDVAAFDLLRKMRMEEEGLPEQEAADAVLRDNVFGLELDPRCTQIAAFALAFAAWKAGGYRKIPVPHIACTGIAVQGQLSEWTKLAGDDANLHATLQRLYELFKNAPDLGSLVNPADVPERERMFTTDYAIVEPLLEKALAKERGKEDPVAEVFGAAAEEVISAAKLLTGTYTLVATNVPYLGTGKQSHTMKAFCERNYPLGKANLATVFVDRCREFSETGGSYALVTPLNWLFLRSYREMRERSLREQSWSHISRLGEGAFETITGHVVKVGLLVISNASPRPNQQITQLDVSKAAAPREKARLLTQNKLQVTSQIDQLRNPNAVITTEAVESDNLLKEYATAFSGSSAGDAPRFIRKFWELPCKTEDWEFHQSTVSYTCPYGGRSEVILWEKERGEMYRLAQSVKHLNHAAQNWLRGKPNWGKAGVIISQMVDLPATLYLGDIYDCNCCAIVPNDQKHLAALWAFCASPDYNREVRKLNQKLNVTPGTLLEVPFDFKHWQKIADESRPLPKPHSDDPTQWLFDGIIKTSEKPLQVAAARFLDYKWPQQKPDHLETCVEQEGIVCLPALAGKASAAERLRTLLVAAYNNEFSPDQIEQLLSNAGFAGKTLEDWLREGFFAQHCQIFHNRPFIWHIWDGRRDGFSALVNFHKLEVAHLDKLIYTYLGAWIEKQRAEVRTNTSGADGRLVAALELQKKLEAIREGNPPYDICVRWKSLEEQPLGWNPDLNDGVRINIRPFVLAGVLRSKFTINWNKDRGKNPDDSERFNDWHVYRDRDGTRYFVNGEGKRVER